MNNEIAQLLMDLPVPGSPMRPSPPKSADEFMRGLSHSLYRDLENAASSVASALMAPARAVSGEYPLMIDPQTGVNYYDGMAEDAAGLAGLVSLGSAPIPRPMNSLGMGGVRTPPSFDEYLNKVNPGRIRISADDRPNLGMGDMYGMMPRGSTQVGSLDAGDLGQVRFMKAQDGSYYASGWNQDVMENDVFGYAMPRGDNMVELAVVNEAQGRGIGSQLQYLLRRDRPYLQSGGLTEQGESALRKTYERLIMEGLL